MGNRKIFLLKYQQKKISKNDKIEKLI
jgi:hypothetical protein